jgi:hypothetical protein
MMYRLNLGFVALAALVWQTLLAAPVLAAPRAVVELFTSQGCSSCPPADALLVELAKRPDLVALTFPVDYWDYLGWKDTLAHPAFTARQRAYAHGRSDRQIYTPQAIVNGTKPCVGSDRAQIEALIGETPGRRTLPVEVSAAENGSTVTVEISAASGQPAADVWVLPVARSRTVRIGRGENDGRTVTYANVVRGVTRVGEWRGEATRLEVPLATARGEADGYVVLVQVTRGTKPGAILGAAKGPGL